MGDLDKIIKQKKIEIQLLKKHFSRKHFEHSIFFKRESLSIKTQLQKSKWGLIPNIPSGKSAVFYNEKDLNTVNASYEKAGAAAVSISSNQTLNIDNLNFPEKHVKCAELTRRHLKIPILRRDIILDPIQLWETRAIGADAVVLLASYLKPDEIKTLLGAAKQMDLEVLMELESEEEIEKITPEVDMLIINPSFSKDKIVKKIPSHFIKLYKNAPYCAETLKALKKSGYDGFLMDYKINQTDGTSYSPFLKLIKQMNMEDQS